MEEYIKTLGENLLDLMGQEKYTLDEMSRKCGISKRKLCQIIYREKKGISLGTLDRISCAIQMPISNLIGCNKLHN